MSETSAAQQSKLYRLWSVPLFLVGLNTLVSGLGDNRPNHLLFGAGALLMAVFAFRHNLSDVSPKALDPKSYGGLDLALLAIGVLLVLAAVIVRFMLQ